MIRCATENLRSRAVPERLGFTVEGTLRQSERLGAAFHDMVQYAMLAEDWKAESHPCCTALIQVRDVPEATVKALKAQAGERGLPLSAYLRAELDRLAARPTNAEIVERLARRKRRGGPTSADTVAEVRRLGDRS